MLQGGRQSAVEAVLTKLLQSLKVFNVAVVGLSTEKGGLTVNRQGVGDITLSENPGITLREMLGSLHFCISFVDLLAQLTTDGVDQSRAEVASIFEDTAKNVGECGSGHGFIHDAFCLVTFMQDRLLQG